VNQNKLLIAFLVIVGSVIGIGAGGLIGYGVKAVFFPTPQGSSFENTADLRQAIIDGDEEKSDPNANASLRQILRVNPSDEIIFSLKPNLNLRFQNAKLITNEHGLRGPSRTFAKPNGTFRIVLLGDSFAFGWGVEHEESFAHLLESKLSKRIGKPVEVINTGVPGYSTFQQVAVFEELGAKFNPDAVLLFFVENDFGLPFMIKNFDNPGSLEETSSREQFQKYKGLENNDWTYLDFINPNSQLPELLKLCKKSQAKLFVAINPNPKAPELRNRLWVLNTEKEIHNIEMREDFLKTIKEREIPREKLQLADDPHPSVIAHDIFAEILSEKLSASLPTS
jgi:lysophospholipase L1-like esterase